MPRPPGKRGLSASTARRCWPVPVGADLPPLLQVVVDTEEEFDWSKPFNRESNAVRNLAHQEKAQKLFDRLGIKPTYVVDYAVASQSMGYGPLREFLADGRCAIGAHLHPWVNPPHLEEVGDIVSPIPAISRPSWRARSSWR